MILAALAATANANANPKIRMNALNGASSTMVFDGTNVVFSNVQDVLVGGVALAKSGAGVSATDFSDLSKTVDGLSKTVDGLSERLLSIETTSQELCIAPPNAFLISSGRRDSKQHGVTGFCK
jgi:hypothetical protein